jgi:hypothetical protein
MKVTRGCSYITPLILNWGTKLGCVVNFVPLSHFTTVKKPWYPLNRRIARPPETIWTFWRTENLQHLSGTNPWIVQPIV